MCTSTCDSVLWGLKQVLMLTVDTVTVDTLVHTKDPVPQECRKAVVYRVPCGSCDMSYVGELDGHCNSCLNSYSGSEQDLATV